MLPGYFFSVPANIERFVNGVVCFVSVDFVNVCWCEKKEISYLCMSFAGSLRFMGMSLKKIDHTWSRFWDYGSHLSDLETMNASLPTFIRTSRQLEFGVGPEGNFVILSITFEPVIGLPLLVVLGYIYKWQKLVNSKNDSAISILKFFSSEFLFSLLIYRVWGSCQFIDDLSWTVDKLMRDFTGSTSHQGEKQFYFRLLCEIQSWLERPCYETDVRK